MKLVDLPEQPFRCDNLVLGKAEPTSAPRREIVSPYTGSAIGTVPMSTAREVDEVVRGAAKAAESWRLVPIKERAQILFRFRELLLRDLERLAHSAAAESGKTVAEGRAGVQKGIEVLEFAIGLPNLDDGGLLEVSRGVTCEARREPLGVVAGITPFNFPAMVPMWMWPIAIVLGNAFVLKPSEKVPITSCRIAALGLEAGLPPGVLSLVHGGVEAVNALIDHPEVKAVGFVGSTPIAKTVFGRAATQGKRALALGGAKNHLIVVPDADPKITIDGVLASFTGCAGQRCMAASLMVAVSPKVDPIIEGIVERAKAMKLGTEMGAIIDRGALERLGSAIGRAGKDGAKIRVDGRDASPPSGYEGGHWLGPTVLDGAAPEHECAREELFGPILTIVRVSTLDEALALDQASPYGNATSVFTTSGAVARYVVDRAASGMVGVNIGVPVPREPFSFGGTKASRFGQGDITGRSGVELWSYLKKVTTKWAAAPDANWMS